ncbi:MAG: hypothetical protein B6I20_14055 [Bacteroidetes bacterium 4572_117]|nr:MAG: hypothetical protein B6I20_14055 [Bacteroidetes bacterium 4572_117]
MDFTVNRFFACVFLCICLSAPSLGQSFKMHNGDTINRIDNNNKKQGYWVIFSATNPKAIETEGNYVNNRKNGVWKSYFPSKRLKSEITFVNNRPNGYAKIFYENGKVSEEGIWKGTKWVGKYNFYHKNGNKAYEWSYGDDGKRTGIQKYYYESGKLRIEGDWQDGKENGTITEFYENGDIKSKKNFAAGKFNTKTSKFYTKQKQKTDNITNNTNTTIEKDNTEENENKTYKLFDGNGQHKLYNAYKKIDREGEFLNGKLVSGKRYFYGADGKLMKTAIYENGRVIKTIRNK